MLESRIEQSLFTVRRSFTVQESRSKCSKVFNKIITYVVPTCFDQLYGHPQATRVHKTKITVENLIFCQNEICLLYDVYRYNSNIANNHLKVKY